MKKSALLFSFISGLLFLMFSLSSHSQNIWINELHYDDAGADIGEFVEIVIENPGSYTLSDFTVTLYNGSSSSGAPYGSETVDNFTVGATSGNYTFYVWYKAGIQNGAPDGICIDYQGTLISGQFLSYEGTFTGVGGPADGVESTDIGVSEVGTTPEGHSLQLSGTGSSYSNFSWNDPADDTPEALNNDQTFGTAIEPVKLAITSINGGETPDINVPFTVTVQAHDGSDVPQNVSSDVNITLSLATGAGNLGGTLTGIIANGTSSIVISGVTYDVAETGVSITATDDAGILTAGTSELFEVGSGPTVVTTIAQLRAGTLGEDFILSEEVILTFQQDFRNQKYIQDATAAILIDDVLTGWFDPGVITTSYNIGDGITGLAGTLNEHENMLQFIPSADPGDASSNGNEITPEVITINEFVSNFENYESELVKISDINFTDGGGTFENGTEYEITDASKATGTFRTTFYSVDYIGSTIPSSASITGIPNCADEGDFITSRNLADIELTGLPAIDKAFAVSSTAVDVYYTVAPSSVDAGDYNLEGTEIIIFANATIDGSNPKLVHLSGAFSPMTSDIILDELVDGGYGSNFEFYAGIMPISYMNVNNPGGVMLDDIWATFQGIVSANDGYNNFWMSDAEGQRNGTYTLSEELIAILNVGDEIVLAGRRDLYFNNAEIAYPILVNINSSGNTPYGPSVIPGSDIDATIPVDTDPAEAWESQLVKIEDFSVVAESGSNYECLWSDGSDADYTFYIGNAVSTNTLVVGQDYESVTGVVDWRGDVSFYRINPRDASDLVFSSNEASKLVITSVNGGTNPFVNTEFEVVVQAQDNAGDPAAVLGDVNFTFTTDGGDGGDVVFITSTVTTGTIVTGTSQIAVSGVQMAPTGTNVTITATDDATTLTAGVSAPFDVVEYVLPEIMITEIMQNPFAVYDSDGEWFEVFNNGDTEVDMNGWTIKDDDSDSHLIGSSVIVPSKGFAVFGINADPGTNGGLTVDYQYTGITLSNGADEVVLIYTDGTTEIDRVNYDGGSEWPDPSGTPMVFTGFPADDNNIGANWSIATVVESTYTSIYGDRGSPGTNGYDQILLGGFKLDLKVYLEGCYDMAEHDMADGLRSKGVIPVEQPFNPTLPYYGNSTISWIYSGTEAASYFQYGVIDWILVELRDAATAAGATGGTVVAQKAALLQSDGTVGYSSLTFDPTYSDELFIVIWHRNHLGIMSSTSFMAVDGDVVAYDFTTGSGQVYNGPAGYTELETDIWGMTAGDVNGDGSVLENDLTDGWSTEAGISVYSGGDLNLDGETNNPDKNDFWVPNMGNSSEVPN